MGSVDRITFEVVRHKLWRIVEEMGATLRRVSGTLTTVEGNDLMCGIYTADGRLVKGGIGFIYHLVPASIVVKHIIEKFSDNPGIFVDDIFLFNDPYLGAMHQPDMYAIAPVHFDGKLVAWCANFVHILDIGAINPGGFCPDATEVYQEGLSLPGLKIVERGVRREDVLGMIMNMSRQPTMVALDIGSQIAACNVAKQRIVELVGKYTPNATEEVMTGLIEHSKKLFIKRLNELPDGTWRATEYAEANDGIYKVSLAMVKRHHSLKFDFTGSSEQSKQSINCTYWGTMGGVYASLLPLVCFDIPWNSGPSSQVSVLAPEGTVVNARRPAPVSFATVGMMPIVAQAAQFTISKMLMASEKYRDEACAVWFDVYGVLKPFGINQYGQYFVGGLLDRFAGSGGATRWGDGLDAGGLLTNTAAASPNVETTESRYPMLYLFKRLRKDSGGPGKYRGGVSGEKAYIIHNAPTGSLRFILYGKGAEAAECYGLSGGYPGCNNRFTLVKNTNLDKLISKRKSIPDSVSQIKGKIEQMTPLTIFEMRKNDIFFVSWAAAGGYGDPLDRDVNLVKRDVENGLVSIGAAYDVYGVVIDPRTFVVDVGKTNRRREEIRKKRIT